MSDLTSEAIYELIRKEMVKILEEDRTSRIREPWSYKFSVDLPKPDGAYDDLVPIDDPDQAQDMLDSFIAEKRWDRMSKPVMDLLEKNKHDVSPWEPEFSEACYQYVQGLGLVLDVIRHRNAGDIEYNVEPFKSETVRVTHSTADAMPPSGLMLSELIDKYVKEKTLSGVWGVRTKKEFPSRIRMMLDIMGDVDVSTVRHEFSRGYKDKLIEYRSHGKPLNANTINILLQAASGLFSYAERHGFVDRNYFDGIRLPNKRNARDEREVFDSKDLEKLFSIDYPGNKRSNPWAFWIPLLGLYTGARLEEISQLHVEDVKMVGNICVIDINDGAGRRLKNASSKRIIPLHPFVATELGFYKHVTKVKSKGMERVFHELRLLNSRYGHTVTGWFKKYRDRVGIEGAKTFHSFRHTFTTNLIHREVPVQVVDWLTGHASPGETAGRYTKLPTDPAVLLPHVLKLDFGVDLSHLKESRFAVKE